VETIAVNGVYQPIAFVTLEKIAIHSTNLSINADKICLCFILSTTKWTYPLVFQLLGRIPSLFR